MTIAKDFAAKFAVAFVAVAMIFMSVAPAAKAETTEDLQKMINDLLAQVAALQSGAGQTAASATGYTWTRDLATGATGADVKELQKFLNADADTRVAVSGTGSTGMETEYYGPATAAAVSKFQVKYRSEILSPANLVNPTGYFGPSTRAKANALNASTGTTTDDSNDEDEDTTDEDTELQGEASLDSVQVEDGESTIEEGDEEVVIGEINFEFVDGDASISRLDIQLSSTSANTYDAFETISLWVDGDMVAEVDAADEDEYLDEDTGEIRFSGLDIVAMEDEEVTVEIAVTVQSNLDTEELTDWDLAATAVRYFDADGVATTDDTTGDLGLAAAVNFDIQEAGTDETLDISLASSNPDATTVVVDTDTDTNDVTILAAELEAQDNDIELTTLIVKVDTTGASTTAVVDDIRLVIDGESFDAESLVSSNKGTISTSQSRYVDNNVTDDAVWYVFDIDGDVVVAEDETVEVEVVVDLNDTDNGSRYDNGTLIKASITSVETDAWDAEGAETLANNQFDGSANGDDHTLVAEGILVPADGFESEEDTLGTNDTVGEFTLTFEVTAVEDDFYITDNATSSSATTDGVKFSVDGTAATITSSLTSTADEDTTGVFTVSEGETETFTLVVTVDPTASGTFRVSLDEVWYSASTNGTTATEDYLPTPVSDFRSASQAIQGS